MHTHGVCPECRASRLLPGVDRLGAAICSDCAGLGKSFRCVRCASEAAIFRAGLCERCSLADDLDAILGTPAEEARLAPLQQYLLRADRPTSILTWLRSAQVQSLLKTIAVGEMPLDHEELDRLPQSGAVNHLRALLIDCGMLESRDESFERFEKWCRVKVTPFAGEHRQAIERYISWSQLRRIRDMHSAGQDTHAAAHNAKQLITAAATFLQWLEAHGTTLSLCTQGDIEVWLTTGNTSRYTVRDFVKFSGKMRLSALLDVPTRHVRAQTRRMTQSDRLAWLNFYLTEASLAPSTRCVAILLLAFGQPLSRIARMRVENVILDTSGAMSLRLGHEETVDVPQPFDAIMRHHLESRARTRTAPVDTNPYLFPGARAGGHVTREQLKKELNDLGVNILAGKNTALDELVASIPGPVVADSFGFSYTAMGAHEHYTNVRYRGYVHGRVDE